MVRDDEIDKCVREIAFLLREGTNEDCVVAADMVDDLGLFVVAAYARLEGWVGAWVRYGIWFLIERTDCSDEEVVAFEWGMQLVDFAHATSERAPKIRIGPGGLIEAWQLKSTSMENITGAK
jgi:hypothetical protein